MHRSLTRRVIFLQIAKPLSGKYLQAKSQVGIGFVTSSRPPGNPIGLAFEWVARITAVALVMVLPGIGGGFAAEHWGIPALALIGWVVGLGGGFVCLMLMTGVWKSKQNGSGKQK